MILDVNAALADVAAVSEPLDGEHTRDREHDHEARRDNLHVYALTRTAAGQVLLGHVSHSSHSSHSSGVGHVSHASHTSHASHVSGQGPTHVSSGPSHNSGSTPPTSAAAQQGKPDLRIAKPGGPLHGNDVYNSIKPQTVQQAGAADTTLTWQISVQNDATIADRIRVRGAKSANGFTVTYLTADGSDVTHAVESGTFRTPQLAHGATYQLRAVVTVTGSAASGTELTGKITGYSGHSPAKFDAVAFVAQRD